MRECRYAQWSLCQPRGTINKPGHFVSTKPKDISRVNTKLTVEELVISCFAKKFHEFRETLLFITAFKRAYQFSLSWPKWIQIMPSRPSPERPFNALFFHLCLGFFKWCLFLQVSQPKPRVHFSYPTYVLTCSVRVILLHLIKTRMYFLLMYQPNLYDIMVTSFRHVSTWQCHLQEVYANLKNHIN